MIPSTEKTSFAIGFIINTVFSRLNPIHGVIGGAVNVLASRIDTLIKPYLRNIFDEIIETHCSEKIKPHVKFACKSIIVLSICNLLARGISPIIGTTLKINVLLSACYKHLFYLKSDSNLNVWGEDSPGQIYASRVRIL